MSGKTRTKNETRVGLCEERGAALFLVLSYMFIATIFLGVFLDSLHFTLKQQRAASRHLVSQNLAQAGIDSAIAHLQIDAKEYEGEENVLLGEGRFSVHVERDDETGMFTVTARGESLAGVTVIDSYELTARIELLAGHLVSVSQWPSRSNREKT